MTPESREFIASARKFFAQFKGLFAEIEELEKIDQLVREGEARLRNLRSVQQETEAIILRMHHDAEKEIAERRSQADLLIAEKHRKADQLIDEATEKAARIVSAASEEAAGFANQVEEHRKTIAGHRETMDFLAAEIERHQRERQMEAIATAAARQQHEDERAALRAFRASLPQ